ncbi:MAG: hypothetical protein QXL01_00825 [Thermoplasmatales archaeon]
MSKALKIKTLINNEGRTALRKAKESGIISGVALDVFEIIVNTPDLTVGEIYNRYVAKYPRTSRSRNELAKRVSDLKNWGAIRTNGETICSQTGRKAFTLVATGEVPNRTEGKSEVLTVPEMVLQPRYATTIPILYSSNELSAAIDILNALRLRSVMWSVVSRILFFVPGLAKKNREVANALQVAITLLKNAQENVD